jgi:hypothetical protein
MVSPLTFHFYSHERLHQALGLPRPAPGFREALWVASSGAGEKPLVPIMS